MEDRPPRQIVRHCGLHIIAPITSGSCDAPPVLSGYDPSLEMGPKSHIAITLPIGEARTCLLIRQLLIREFAVPPDEGSLGFLSIDYKRVPAFLC
ncbi:hypothetical protein AVEN_218127-1 [Araneus ventricosus]|uniref:Uncharacterized protein n=1 Tax=Araneus ventricosus TaxID=182803 RepID=A0A4Y2I4R1_ARAVE|nr:hypothetical protein AVEN_218127-1 [Araneus ventricosus]